MSITAEGRLQQDIENIAEMVIDNIEGALWHLGNDKTQAIMNMKAAIDDLQEALKLLKESK